METETYEPGKLFVGGLSWETNEQGFREYFEKYGEIADVKIMEEPETKKPRGFGFVTFKDPTSVEKVLKEPSHFIDKKKVDPKQATLKPSSMVSKKIFVGGLPIDAEDKDVIDAFSMANMKVSSVDIKMDKDTGKSRGFGFVDFHESEDATKAVSQKFIDIKQKQVEIKKAEPRSAKGKNAPQGGTDFTPYPNQVYSMQYPRGGGYAGNPATGGHPYPYYHQYQHQAGYSGYSQGFNQHGQYPYDYSAAAAYNRGSYAGNYTGQQHMTTYPQDGTPSAYTQQARTSYGGGADQYGTVAGFGYEHGATYNYTDQSTAGVPYGGVRTNPQQRTGFTYANRN